MVKYNPKNTVCPKCNHNNLRIQYVNIGVALDKCDNQDFIQISCISCTYSFTLLCADAVTKIVKDNVVQLSNIRGK